MKSIQKSRIEDSMAGLLINGLAFKEVITYKSISTDRRSGKAILALDRPSVSMNYKFTFRISNIENLPCHQRNNELNYVDHNDDLKHILATVLSTSPKSPVFTKAIDRSSGMLTNTVCRN